MGKLLVIMLILSIVCPAVSAGELGDLLREQQTLKDWQAKTQQQVRNIEIRLIEVAALIRYILAKEAQEQKELAEIQAEVEREREEKGKKEK